MERQCVFGCSSLGAIRAYELRYDGMVGLGRVYGEFFKFDDFMDDEVALLHAPAPFYFPLSIPLVNVRFALARLERENATSADTSARIINRLKARYFGDRTPDLVLEVTREEGGAVLSETLRSRISHYDVKRLDFENALRHVTQTTPPNSSVSSELGHGAEVLSQMGIAQERQL